MKNSIDINKAREDTLGTKNVIHFNNAGASLMPMPVSKALHEYLEAEEKFGGYETASKYEDSLNKFYTSAAKLLNCSRDEIAFLENATRAWDMALYAFKFKPGDKILISMAEYGSSVIAYLQQSKKLGIELVYIPNDALGQIDTGLLTKAIDDNVKLISIAHIPTGGGLVNPVEKVGQIAKNAGIPFLLDSCQAVGQLHIDVEAIGCDMLCATGRKYLRGPRGTGFLYVRKNLIEKLEPPFLDQHAAELVSPDKYIIRKDAKRFENWEQNCAGKMALAKAIEYALTLGLPEIQNRVLTLAKDLRSQLSKIGGITVTDEGENKCGIVTFMHNRLDAYTIQSKLASHKINVSISDGSGSLISFNERNLTALVRASVHYYNTNDEVDFFIKTLQSMFNHN